MGIAGCQQGADVSQAQVDASMSEEGAAEKVIDAQLAAYNRQDADAFAAFFSDSVAVYSPPQTLRLSGKAALQARYQQLFERAPTVQARVLDRTKYGRFVVDREMVSGLPGGNRLEALVIYEVRDSTIQTLWVLPF
ncbi:MAG: hypothetical protein RhofKO_22790 [Rhodothermales bacterium]